LKAVVRRRIDTWRLSMTDHRHFGEKESNYTFQTPEKLIADFERGIARWDRENSDS
jgi:hypothetical protein